MFYQDWDKFYYPGLENWYHVPAPQYHYQYHHHHRPRRKYGPYMVPSDPYLLHSGPSDYFFAGSSQQQRSPANANATSSANLRDNFTSVHQHRTHHQLRSPQHRPNTLR